MLALAEAERRLLERTSRLAAEAWPVDGALGRVVARDVWAPSAIPPQAVAARRGYAVRHRDLPGRLTLWGTLGPHETFEGAMGRNRAMRVEAGAAIPADATAVISEGNLPTDGEHVTIGHRVGRGEGILAEGAELSRERPLLTSGTRLNAADLLLLDSLGLTSIEVFRRPRIAFSPRRAGPLSSWLARDARAWGAVVGMSPWGTDAPLSGSETERWDAVVQLDTASSSEPALIRSLPLQPGGDLELELRGDVWRVRLESSALGTWVGWRWTLQTLWKAWTGGTAPSAAIPARLAADVPRDAERRRVVAVGRTSAEPSDLAIPTDGESGWSLRNTWGTVTVEPGTGSLSAGSMVRVEPWP